MSNRGLKFLALIWGLCVVPSAVLAQDFLSKPVRIVVPQTPGGASDALARIVGQKLSEKWGQSVVIENRAGAGGNVGMEHVAQAAADGHTLLMSYAGSHAINAALYKKLPFDPEKDFEPVATLATLPSPEARVRGAFRQALGRDPAATELAEATTFLGNQPGSPATALGHLLWALVSGPEFLTNH